MTEGLCHYCGMNYEIVPRLDDCLCNDCREFLMGEYEKINTEEDEMRDQYLANPYTTANTARDKAILKAREILRYPEKHAIVDVESTGFLPRGEVVEFAAIAPNMHTLLHCFVMPVEDSHPKAVEVHGITKQALVERGAPPWPAVHNDVQSAIAGRTVVAYNARFDTGILAATAARHGLSLEIADVVCAMEIWYAFSGERKGKLKGDHTAIGDCYSTVEMLHQVAWEPLASEVLTRESPEAVLAAFNHDAVDNVDEG